MAGHVQHQIERIGHIIGQLHDRTILTTKEARTLLGLPIGCEKCQKLGAAEPARR